MPELTESGNAARTQWWAPTELPMLSNDEVHVWKASVEEWASHEVALGVQLDEHERSRAARFHFTRDRQQFVVAHALLRTLLGAYLQQPPAALQFDVGPAGKPRLTRHSGEPAVEFNLSHAADVVLIGITRATALGVDVERWLDDVEPEELAEHFFSRSERAELQALASGERLAGFFSCWTRKEAYIKATGLGVSKGLDYFDVVLRPDRPAKLLADRLTPENQHRWRMINLDIESGYSGAIVVAHGLSVLRTFSLAPGAMLPA